MITNEIKAKVFANYLGQRVLFYDNDYNQGGDQTLDNIMIAGCGNTNMREFDFIGSDIYLVLRPLSAITDEDRDYAVYSIIGFHVGSARTQSDFTKERVIAEVPKSARLYQYLQSKGYDLPHYLLGGKTLHECGLAVYEQENAKI